MSGNDPHKLKKISNWVAVAVSAFFAAVAVAGYQNTQDIGQLVAFLALAVVAVFVVKGAFWLIGYLLDKLEG